MKWLFPAFAALLAIVSLLTIVRAPDWVWTWKLAILVGEYGHWLVLLPAGLALASFLGQTGAGRLATVVLCLVAAGCFLRPVRDARPIAENLSPGLQAAFGRDETPFKLSYRRLYRGADTLPAAVRTEIFARPDGQELKLDFYRSGLARDVLEKPRPCVVVIHGGGWDSGDRLQLPELNHRLVALGYAVAAIDYRLAPRWQWPAPKEDTLAALAWLKKNAVRLDIDASRLVLLGRSAGGQIAEVVGYTAHDPAIRGVITFYGPSDMVFGYRNAAEDDAIRSPSLMRALLGGTPEQQPARYDDASALRFVVPESPPTLMLHGRLDTLALHQHDVRLAAQLARAGVPHYFLSLPWATHGFDYNLDGPGGQLASFAITQFLAAVTK